MVLATVVQTQGSVPREVGAKMLIGSDGFTFGTIGGGAGEAKVIRQAEQVLETGQKQMVIVDLTGAAHRDTQGICGGMMQVWLERWTGAAAQTLAQQILMRLETGQTATLVIPFESNQSPYLVDTDVGVLSGSAINDENTFIGTLQPPPTLLIVGAGHVGMQLAKIADMIGFQVMVQDDRSEWANSQHYPQATKIFAELTTALTDLATHPQLFAALVTRGYQYDLAALTGLLQRPIPCRYIGMIGSKKRVRQVLQTVEQNGISRSQLQSIYAPIGLDIGALTPEEIAVSIAAELIWVQRGGSGRPLSEKSD
ncbi:XdhC family protein [Leptolyngbya sp. NK1-12]|uniref:XdhC family protein n=1 Tax=Leptolyngbya sp. NK1-12 TaxID=2547451 RepID=UPI002930440D